MTFSYPFVETRSREGWDTWHRFGVDIDEERGLVLARDPRPIYEPLVPLVNDPSLAVEVVDLALDVCENFYSLSVTGELYHYDGERKRQTHIACLPGDDENRAFEHPRALALASDTLFIAHGAKDESRVHAFSRHLLQRRWTVTDPFEDPVAMLDRDGLAHVLDRGVPPPELIDVSTPGPGFVATLDEDGTVTIVCRELGPVVDFATDERGWVYVLTRDEGDGDDEDADPGRYVVRVFDENYVRQRLEVPSTAFPNRGEVELGVACLDVSIDGSLYVGVPSEPEEGGGVYRYAVGDMAAGGDDDGDAVEPIEDGGTVSSAFERLPTVAFGCTNLLLRERRRPTKPTRMEGETSADAEMAESSISARLYLVDEATKRVFSFDRTTRHLPSRGGPARFVGRAVKRFDAGEQATVWHRVKMAIDDSDLGTGVRLRYFALDSPARYDPTDEGETVEGRTDEPESDDESDRFVVENAFRPEGFERIPGLSPEAIRHLKGANVLGVTGLAGLTVDTVLDIVSPLSEPISRATVRSWLATAEELSERWTRLEAIPPLDALLDEDVATGRYLWVELELTGDEFVTPTVESFRAYFPRQSYLRYLPAIYRENASSAAFLERFLSVFESTYTDIEEDIAGLTRYFDVTGVPEEHLGWLAAWLGVSLDETWSEMTRRELLGRATELSKMRGTRAGLLTLLEIVLRDVETRSVSWDTAFERERQTVEALAEKGFFDGDIEVALSRHAELVDEYERYTEKTVYIREYGDFECTDTPGAKAVFHRALRCPQCFVVLVRAVTTDAQLDAIRRLVRTETPAHAVGDVVSLRSRFEVDRHSYLGVNSVVSEGQFVVESSGLGRDSTLSEREPHGQLDVGARLGRDARLS